MTAVTVSETDARLMRAMARHGRPVEGIAALLHLPVEEVRAVIARADDPVAPAIADQPHSSPFRIATPARAAAAPSRLADRPPERGECRLAYLTARFERRSVEDAPYDHSAFRGTIIETRRGR